MRLLMGLVMVLVASPEAWAWEHNLIYRECDETIEWWLSDSPDTPEFAEEVISEAFDTWLNLIDCSAGHTFMGVREGHNTGMEFDGYNTFYFGDPAGEIDHIADVSRWTTGTIAFAMGGTTYVYVEDADIVFNNGITWLTTDQANDPSCEEGLELKSIALHEIGHSLGLGHSCDAGEDCPDPLKQEAIMHWTGPEDCDASRSSLNADDEEGIRALNGGWAEVNAETELAGAVPFEFCLSILLVTSDPEPASEIDWGDGTESGVYSTGESICHTYESTGEPTVAVDWETSVLGYGTNRGTASLDVYVCDAVELETDEDIIDIEESDVGVYRLSLATEAIDERCLNTVQWEVKQDALTLIESDRLSPLINLDPGRYAITLTLDAGGVEVTDSEELVVPSPDCSPACDGSDPPASEGSDPPASEGSDPPGSEDAGWPDSEEPEEEDKGGSGCSVMDRSSPAPLAMIVVGCAGLLRRKRRFA